MAKKETLPAVRSAPNRYGKPGHEPCDPIPVAMPIGYTRPTPIHDLIAKMVRQAIIDEKGDEFESIEEADDFEEEDPDTLDLSPYTLTELNEQEPLQREPERAPRPEPPSPTGDTPNPDESEPG